MCSPKLNHIVAVVPNHNLTYLKQLESEFKSFINKNNPSVVDKTRGHMPKKMGGLRMIDINNFWKAIRMSWLRRFIESKSTWAKLHKAETLPYTFNPATPDDESFIKVKFISKKQFWKEVYASLLSCRNNILTK